MTKNTENSIYSKGVYTGTIEIDEKGNYFCGKILLDYKMVSSSFSIGDLVTIKTVIVNPSDMTYNEYPQKTRNFALANHKPETKN